MPIPTLQLPSTWNATKKTTISTTTTKLGDGYDQIVVGFPDAEEEWNITSVAMPPEEARNKLNQLRLFSGVTCFYWSPDNGLTIPLQTFVCDGWTTTRLGINYHQINGTFKPILV